MASSKKGFSTVETNIEEMHEQIRRHRKSMAKRILFILLALAVVFIGTELWLALRTFSGYTVERSYERHDSAAVSFANFGNYLLKYSNDGITCVDGENRQLWNQSYEMTSPKVSLCQDYVLAYDHGGLELYIISSQGPAQQLEMSKPIVSASISKVGTTAVLMKEGTVATVKLFDKTGKELVSGEFFRENGGFPVDVALSYDAKKMAVAMVDVSDGKLKSTITFYNFGSVGQNEINNNVGLFSYSDIVIPEIEYLSDDKMIALGDSEIVTFEGTEKPEVSSEIFLEPGVRSVFYNEKNIGVIKESTEGAGFRISLYNGQGRPTMNVDTTLEYSDAYFLENGEVCLTSDTACEIYTRHSIKKFNYMFEKRIRKILSQESGTQYLFIFEEETQGVRLK